MTTPNAQPPDAPPIANGRTVVAAFVAIAVLAGGLALWLRYENRDPILDAQQKAMPTLAAQVAVRCVPASGEPFELHRGGHCPPGASLTLTMTAPGFGTESVLYALLSSTRSQAGALVKGQTSTLDPGTDEGPRTLLVVLASTPVAATDLQAAVDGEGDVTRRVSAVNAMIAGLIRSEKHARVERFDFDVSAAR